MVEWSDYQKLIGKARNEKRYWSLNGKDVLWLPIQVPQGVSVLGMLRDVFEKYKHLIRWTDTFKFCFADTEIKQVDAACNGIINVLEKYLTGDVIEAYKMFSNLMDQYYPDFPNEDVETDLLLYRMRKDLDLKEEKQFYHLPKSMRYKCSGERFSIAGYPCFYIGYSKNDCYVEIGETGSMIAMSLNDAGSLKVFDLTFSEGQQNGDGLKEYLIAFPLIASCYVVTMNCDDADSVKFREEYVIPQMLTSYMKDKGRYDGIRYYSVRNENLKTLGRDEDDYRNLVLFTNLNDSDEYDMELMNKFHWYKPFNVK